MRDEKYKLYILFLEINENKKYLKIILTSI